MNPLLNLLSKFVGICTKATDEEWVQAGVVVAMEVVPRVVTKLVSMVTGRCREPTNV